LIERGTDRSPAVISAVRSAVRELRALPLDTLVLGCSHAFILKDVIQRFIGKQQIYDGLTRSVEAIREAALIVQTGDPSIYPDCDFLCSGDPTGFPEYASHYLQIPKETIRITLVPPH
jgi:glutamate racemase